MAKGVSYFIETPMLRDVLTPGSQGHKALTEATADGSWTSSQYVMSEFTRGLLCNLIEFYFVLKDRDSVQDAIEYWEQDSAIRKVKDFVFAMRAWIPDEYLGNDKRYALQKFRGLLLRFQWSLEDDLPRRTKDRIKCFYSKLKLKAGSPSAMEESMKRLYKSSQVDKSKECRLSGFLSRAKTRDLFAKWVAASDSDALRGNASFAQLAGEMTHFLSGELSGLCVFCKKGADAVIALEYPQACVLVTKDKVFDALCLAAGKKHKRIGSVRTLAPKARVLGELADADH